MKNVLKLSAIVLTFNLIGSTAFAQNETATIYPKATAMEEVPTAPAATGNKPVIITLRNAAEKSVAVYAGPKEGLKEPKVNVVGGLSKNILYLNENDAVCLLTIDKRPSACTIIKPGISTVEINLSANAISSK